MAFLPAEAESSLLRALSRGRLAHAYLISGPVGSGKNAFIQKLGATLLNCSPEELEHHPDYHSARPESKSRRILTEQIRALESALRQKALKGGRKVAVIHEAERLQPQAANAFLITLEEPPPDCHIFLVSAQPELLLDTIRSRCIDVALRPSAPPVPSEGERRIADALTALLDTKKPLNVARVFQFVRVFQAVLNDEREAIRKSHTALLDEEKKRLDRSTEGSWLEEREEQIVALIEAAATRKRSELLRSVADAFAEAARAAYISTPLSPPARAISARFTQKDILLRLDALDSLSTSLGHNVNEALALEAGFLNVFLPSP